jgi:hypothetical protein
MVLTDKLGRTAICPTPTSVSVRDSIAPDVPECRIFSATADTVYLNAAGVATYNAAQLSPTDACGVSTVQISNGYNVNFGNTVTFNCSPNTAAGIHGTGANNLYARVRDINNNFRNSLSLSSSFYPSCRIRILAFDTIPPNAICHPTRTLALASNGLATATATTINNGSFATCSPSGPLLYTINNGASVTYNCDSIGTRAAYLIVTKNNTPQQGGISRDTCISIINVVDVTAPNAVPIPGTTDPNPAPMAAPPATEIPTFVPEAGLGLTISQIFPNRSFKNSAILFRISCLPCSLITLSENHLIAVPKVSANCLIRGADFITKSVIIGNNGLNADHNCIPNFLKNLSRDDYT